MKRETRTSRSARRPSRLKKPPGILPDAANFYTACQDHPKMLRVVALSGGYSREQANRLLAENNGMIASFSRALSEGLSAQQSEAEFNDLLDSSIQSIFEASNT